MVLSMAIVLVLVLGMVLVPCRGVVFFCHILSAPKAFLTVVRETVEELAVEAAAQALQDEEARAEGMHKRCVHA